MNRLITVAGLGALGRSDVYRVPRAGAGWADALSLPFNDEHSGGWGEPEHLPAPVNSAGYEYGPTLSPDRRWLYYTSHRDGRADVYRIEVRRLGLSEEVGSNR